MINLVQLMKTPKVEPIPSEPKLSTVAQSVPLEQSTSVRQEQPSTVSAVQQTKPIPPNGHTREDSIVHKPIYHTDTPKGRQAIDIRTLPIAERIRLRAEAMMAKQHLAERAKEDTKLDNQLSGMDLAFPDVPSKQQVPIAIQHTVLAPAKVEDGSETFSLSIKLNEQQQLAAEYAAANKCFVLTGAAGTGKTTAAREIAKGLLNSGNIGTHNFYVGEGQYVTAPSIAFCAFTNRASSNMRRALHKDVELEEKLFHNVVTIHKLLEFMPEEYFDSVDNKMKFRFSPRRNAQNKLGITHLVIEEASTVDLPLWAKVYDALEPGTIIIFIGDINQLPPVFGASILNYALINLPVVELHEVYRQALDSPVLSNAHKALRGEKLEPDGKYFKLLQTKPGGKLQSEQGMATLFVNSMKQWIEKGEYDPKTDIILSPFNKAKFPCGTKMLNYHLAQYLGDKVGAKVHHILAGRNTWYLAEGDRVMIDKQDGTIKRIVYNAKYMGKAPRSLAHAINRFGLPTMKNVHFDDEGDFELKGYEELNVDDIPEEEAKQAASHIIDIELDDGGYETLESAGDFGDNRFSLGYCLSIHKAQGCEWRKVVLILHRSFSTLLFRELIYTAITRAREYCIIVDLTNTVDKAIKSQRIKGNDVKEKIEWFNSKLALTEHVPIVP